MYASLVTLVWLLMTLHVCKLSYFRMGISYFSMGISYFSMGISYFSMGISYSSMGILPNSLKVSSFITLTLNLIVNLRLEVYGIQ